MAERPTALVLRAQGTNCDQELCRAFELAGAAVIHVHIDRVIARPNMVAEADLIGFPGGFSYGDDVASGRLFAVRLRERLWPVLSAAAERGVPMIGVCNGFQVLVQLGLLPGFRPGVGDAAPTDAPSPTVALATNDSGRFIDRWVGVEGNGASPCVWTRPFVDEGEFMLPIAHAEGRFVGRVSESQVALRYSENPNGSEGSVAGICDPTGLIFGLMPHPERFLSWTRYPAWTRMNEQARRGDTPGQRMFRAAVEAATMNSAV